MIRYHTPYSGMRFLADMETKIIHDLENETSSCNIDDIEEENILMVETEEEVRALCIDEEYKGCHWCNYPFDVDLIMY